MDTKMIAIGAGVLAGAAFGVYSAMGVEGHDGDAADIDRQVRDLTGGTSPNRFNVVSWSKEPASVSSSGGIAIVERREDVERVGSLQASWYDHRADAKALAQGLMGASAVGILAGMVIGSGNPRAGVGMAGACVVALGAYALTHAID